MAKGQVFLMTDKAETKDCQCTYPQCQNICRVNKFYTPSKARCPEHAGKPMVRASDGSFKFHDLEPQALGEIEVPDLPANHNLGQMHCPVCDEPLEILATDGARTIDFACAECQTGVTVSFDWRVCQIRNVPEPLHSVVKEFNIRQVGTMDMSLSMKMGRARTRSMEKHN